MNIENSTSIVGGLSEFKEEKKSSKSLLQRIEEATSIEEIQNLLKLGGTYKKASNGTIRMWAKAGAKRMKLIELGLR